jgi:hypothetical protein
MTWINDIEEFVRDTNDLLSNREMAAIIGCAPSTVSWLRCRWGLKKLELEYWTPVQVAWLRRLYTWMGDYEIALVFDEAYPKAKGWTLKHIEKKRKYLGLKRTREQLLAIKRRNYDFGCFKDHLRRIHHTRKADEGVIREWLDSNGQPYSVIKVGEGFVRLSRYTWEQHKGPVPEGMNIVLKDAARPASDINNLECITNAELGMRNSMMRYPVELRQLIVLNNQLKKTIHEYQPSA